jgi:hypothetical protein
MPIASKVGDSIENFSNERQERALNVRHRYSQKLASGMTAALHTLDYHFVGQFPVFPTNRFLLQSPFPFRSLLFPFPEPHSSSLITITPIHSFLFPITTIPYFNSLQVIPFSFYHRYQHMPPQNPSYRHCRRTPSPQFPTLSSSSSNFPKLSKLPLNTHALFTHIPHPFFLSPPLPLFANRSQFQISMRRFHRLSSKDQERLACVMERLVEHPMSRVFLDFAESRETQPHHELHVIYEKVITQTYNTLEEWRDDIRALPRVCDYSQTTHVAREICKICEIEYRQLIAGMSVSDWRTNCAVSLSRLQRTLDDIPAEYCFLGEIDALLAESQRAVETRRLGPVQRRVIERRRGGEFGTLEPIWMMPELEDNGMDDDDDEFRLHFLKLGALIERERELMKKMAESRAVVVDEESSPAGEGGSPGAGRGRSRVSAGQRKSRTPPSPRTPQTPPEKETLPRGRRERTRSREENERIAPVSDEEVCDFMRAVVQLTAPEDKTQLCFLIARMERAILIDEPILSVDLAQVRTETLRELIEFTRTRFRHLGRSYPDGDAM